MKTNKVESVSTPAVQSGVVEGYTCAFVYFSHRHHPLKSTQNNA